MRVSFLFFIFSSGLTQQGAQIWWFSYCTKSVDSSHPSSRILILPRGYFEIPLFTQNNKVQSNCTEKTYLGNTVPPSPKQEETSHRGPRTGRETQTIKVNGSLCVSTGAPRAVSLFTHQYWGRTLCTWEDYGAREGSLLRSHGPDKKQARPVLVGGFKKLF